MKRIFAPLKAIWNEVEPLDTLVTRKSISIFHTTHKRQTSRPRRALRSVGIILTPSPLLVVLHS
jgi:hypothetical protein